MRQPRIVEELTAAGVSLWLDDLDRTRLGGGLAALIAGSGIRGVTTNPTIFDKALGSGAQAYHEQLTDLASRNVGIDEAIRAITTDDVRAACDILLPTWQDSGGLDGRVSIEVDPRLAHDTQGTIDQARDLWRIVDRPNAMIKIPATEAGLPAVTDVLAEGISVNVTLIFSIERYREVMAAHTRGLQRALAAGIDPSSIESVASFFVSRVDAAVDARLDALSGDSANTESISLRGKAAIANARLAWQAHLDHTSGDTWRSLNAAGARPQRPLWASTGVKDPAYDATRYVVELVGPGCVNTVPEPTLEAVISTGRFRGDTMTGTASESQEVVDSLAELGIDIKEVCTELEAAGVRSFIDSWLALRATVGNAIGAPDSISP